MTDDAYNMLVEMVSEAYEAMRSENMVCPWCSGHLSCHDEHHDQFCEFQKHRHLFKPAKELITDEALVELDGQIAEELKKL